MSPGQYLEQAKLVHEAMVKAGVSRWLTVRHDDDLPPRVLLTWDTWEDRFHGQGKQRDNGHTEFVELATDGGVVFESNRPLPVLEPAA